MLKLGGWSRLTWGLGFANAIRHLLFWGFNKAIHPRGLAGRRTARLSDRSTTRHSQPRWASQTLWPAELRDSEGQARIQP